MYRSSDELYESGIFSKTTQRDCYLLLLRFLHFADNDLIDSKDINLIYIWGLSAGYQPRPQVVDRGTTARYGGQLRYI